MRKCSCGNVLDTEEERGSGLCDTCYLKSLKRQTMDIYIAAPYPIRDRAVALMQRLEAEGFGVTSTWLREDDELADKYAQLDLDDIGRSDALVLMNPDEWKNAGTGGRHVEMGFALGLNRHVVVVGERSNIFHYLDEVVICAEADLVTTLLAIDAGLSKRKTA
jgi:hypothetical protein